MPDKVPGKELFPGEVGELVLEVAAEPGIGEVAHYQRGHGPSDIRWPAPVVADLATWAEVARLLSFQAHLVAEKVGSKVKAVWAVWDPAAERYGWKMLLANGNFYGDFVLMASVVGREVEADAAH